MFKGEYKTFSIMHPELHNNALVDSQRRPEQQTTGLVGKCQQEFI